MNVRSDLLALVFAITGLGGCSKEMRSETAPATPVAPVTSATISMETVRELPVGCIGYTLPATIETERKLLLVEYALQLAMDECDQKATAIRNGHETRELDRLKAVDQKGYALYMEHIARRKDDDALDELKTSSPALREYLIGMELAEDDYDATLKATSKWKRDMVTVAYNHLRKVATK